MFEIEENRIKLYFTKLLGSRYHRENAWDDPLEDKQDVMLEFKLGKGKIYIKEIQKNVLFERNENQKQITFNAVEKKSLSR